MTVFVCSGSIDALGAMCAYAVVSTATFDAKVQFVFEVFDFNGNGSISQDELVRCRDARLLFLPGVAVCLGSCVCESERCVCMRRRG